MFLKSLHSELLTKAQPFSLPLLLFAPAMSPLDVSNNLMRKININIKAASLSGKLCPHPVYFPHFEKRKEDVGTTV